MAANDCADMMPLSGICEVHVVNENVAGGAPRGVSLRPLGESRGEVGRGDCGHGANLATLSSSASCAFAAATGGRSDRRWSSGGEATGGRSDRRWSSGGEAMT